MKKYLFLTLMIFAFLTISKSSANAQSVKIGGYMQTWFILNQETQAPSYLGIDDGTSGIRIRRARLSAKADLDEVFSVNIMLELADGSRNLYDFSLSAKVAPELVFTLGQFIVPCQMYETGKLSSAKIPLYELSDIALTLSRNMGYDSYRDVGLMVNGNISNMFKYYAYYGNGTGKLSFAGSNILNRKLTDGLYGLRLEVEPTKGVSIGGQYSINNQDSIYVRDPVSNANNIIYRDRNSLSFDVATEKFGLPFLSTMISYGMGQVKDGNYPLNYNGLSATLMFDITKRIQLTGRFDTYNQKYDTDGAEESKYNNIIFGVNWFYYKGNEDIFRVGINYHIKNESLERDKVDNNMFLVWTQLKF